VELPEASNHVGPLRIVVEIGDIDDQRVTIPLRPRVAVKKSIPARFVLSFR